jgi:hypothetical protein
LHTVFFILHFADDATATHLWKVGICVGIQIVVSHALLAVVAVSFLFWFLLLPVSLQLSLLLLFLQLAHFAKSIFT